MTSEMLQKARDYEKLHRPEIAGELPAYHLTGGVGWINDPNGFAPYKGEYHLFFQYYPYDTQWGPMHWGHAKTSDFIRWEFLPAALAPDRSYDKDGCFSGGAVELPDGRHLLLYTGVSIQPQNDGTTREFQTQCVAIGDGVDYEKYEHNPVITAESLPEGGSTRDFRDPKIWRENGVYYAVTVNRGKDGSGDVLLYESEDGLHWQFSSILASCGYRYGTMWECPDFFHLDGKDVLIHSIMEMRAKNLKFHNGNSKMYHIGTLDAERHFRDETVHAMEYGLDFYAPQTLEALDGRRILVGWMQAWEGSKQRIPGMGFMGQMTVPRELTIRDGRLLQTPVRELEGYRCNKVEYKSITIQEETALPGISGRVLDMVLEITPTQTPYTRFDLEIAKGEDFFTTISLLPQKGTIRMDRTFSGFPHDVNHVREFPADFHNGKIRLRLLLDRYSAELFVGDGEQAASMVLYTPQNADGITLRCDTAAVVSIEKYDLEMK
ncbi:MAG: glycoside hydrolase family 32 protein [Faecousia sp.]